MDGPCVGRGSLYDIDAGGGAGGRNVGSTNIHTLGHIAVGDNVSHLVLSRHAQIHGVRSLADLGIQCNPCGC
jgi:hypothetical protein